VVVEAAGLVEVDYIVEAGHIVDIAERKDIVGEKMDIADLVLLAGGDSSVLYK